MKLMGWEMMGDGCWVLGVDDVWIYNKLYRNH